MAITEISNLKFLALFSQSATKTFWNRLLKRPGEIYNSFSFFFLKGLDKQFIYSYQISYRVLTLQYLLSKQR